MVFQISVDSAETKEVNSKKKHSQLALHAKIFHVVSELHIFSFQYSRPGPIPVRARLHSN